MSAVALIGVVVAELGFPGAAPAAAVLLALHPWHVRYGADGRGYSFLLLFVLAGALFLLRFLRSGRWRDALACAATQLALLWTFPLAVYVPLAFGVVGCGAIALGPEPREDRRRRLGRFVVAHVLAAMAFLQLMAPNLGQAAAFKKEWRDRVPLDWPWLRQLWVYLTLGARMREPREPDVVFPTFAVLREAWPWLRVVVYGVLPALALAGCARVAARAQRAERAVFLSLGFAAGLFLLHRAVHGFFVLPRFAFFFLAVLVPALAIGVEGALLAVLWGGWARRAVPAGLALALAGYAALAAPELRVLLTHPPTPSREVAAFLAARDAEAPRGVLRAGLGLGGEVARVYDPWLLRVETRAELDALAARSLAEGRPLYVVFSYAALNARRIAALFEPVLDPRFFAPEARFDGIEGELVIRVRRYTGAPLDGSRGG